MITGTENSIPSLEDFHKIGKNGAPYDIIDEAISQYILGHQHILVLNGQAYLYKDGVYRCDENGTILQKFVKSCIVTELITYSRIQRVCKLILSEHDLQVEPEEVNCYPKHWVNFKNGMLDILTGELHDHDPKYRSVNQIPHNYIPDLNIEESVFHKFIQSRIQNVEDQQMLYEYMGYCLLKDIVFQKFLILYGMGDAGKSRIINFVTRIVGNANISSLPLQDIGERFSTAYLLNKQLNTCGDIKPTAMKDTSVIKQLLGEDAVKGEIKGGKIFFFKNRAKFLFSCNELPLILDDRSNGFYRRLILIHFSSKGEYIPNLDECLAAEDEVEIVISHIVQGAKTALLRCKLFESVQSLGAVSKLNMESDTVAAFLEDYTEEGDELMIRRADVYGYYENYCREEKRQPLGKTGFFRGLEAKGYLVKAIRGVRYFKGFDIKFRRTEEPVFD